MEHDHGEDNVSTLLRRAQAAGGHVDAFARIHLSAFSDACAEALRWQKTEGRLRVTQGEEPDAIRRETERRIEEARARLRGVLRGLLAWADQTGRSEAPREG